MVVKGGRAEDDACRSDSNRRKQNHTAVIADQGRCVVNELRGDHHLRANGVVNFLTRWLTRQGGIKSKVSMADGRAASNKRNGSE